MSKDRTLVRASDIGLWAYCHRAWWLAQVKGAPHENPQILSRGADAHAAHGARTLRAQQIQRIGLWLLLIALAALAIALIMRLFF
ncbi:MAG: hypothetical protein ACK47M_12690 [Caldilinea sp.]